MTTEKLIPADVTLAAKRGFLRTASQSIATALAGGLTVGIVTNAVAQAQSGDWTPIIVSAAVAVATPLINGAQSYFDIHGRGIPAEYKPVIPPTDAADGTRAELPPALR